MPILKGNKPSFTPPRIPEPKRSRSRFSAPQVPDFKWTKPDLNPPQLPELKLGKPNFSAPELPELKWSTPRLSTPALPELRWNKTRLRPLPLTGFKHSAHEAAGRMSDVADAAQAQAGKRLNDAVASRPRVNVRKPLDALPSLKLGRRKTLASRIASGTTADALLRAQLAKTSRQLAHESSDIGEAVGALKSTIKLDRQKARSARRRRLASNMMVGAAVMYHLDPTQGRERRRSTGRVLKRLAGWVQQRKP